MCPKGIRFSLQICSASYLLLIIINAAITPGTQPAKVSMNTIMMDPQPYSRTARGGNIIAKMTLKTDIKLVLDMLKIRII